MKDYRTCFIGKFVSIVLWLLIIQFFSWIISNFLELFSDSSIMKWFELVVSLFFIIRIIFFVKCPEKKQNTECEDTKEGVQSEFARRLKEKAEEAKAKQEN